MSVSKPKLRKETNVFLLGNYNSQIIGGNKLPSYGDVLKVLFYNIREVHLSVHESAVLTVNETLIFWQKARIPTRTSYNCVKQLENLYEEWRTIQKSAHRPDSKQSKAYLEKKSTFIAKLDDLFDIAHQRAESMIQIDEDKDFLHLQRQKGRPGYMHGVDVVLAAKERKADERAQQQRDRELRQKESENQAAMQVELINSSSSSAERSNSSVERPSCSNIGSALPGPSHAAEVVENVRRGHRQVITSGLVTVLDRCQVSDRNAVRIIIAVLQALGLNIDEYIVNKTSINRERRKKRELMANRIKEEFKQSNLNAAVLHWDGKLLPALTGRQVVDRLPVLLTNGELEQLLYVPPLESSTGKMQAQAIFDVLSDWELKDSIKACCFDTTASNTGRFNGACTVLEKYLDRDLLYLPCRHHIFELLIRAVFEAVIPGTSGPDVALFKKFPVVWSKIDIVKFLPGVTNPKVAELFSEDKAEIVHYLQTTLREAHSRDDYKEFLQLCLIFLGESPSTGKTTFAPPGAVHHARWMAKVLYTLKIYLFRKEFKMNAKTETALSDVCIFILKVYVKVWFSAPSAIKAPFGDFSLMKKLHEYKKINSKIADAALKKLLNHLWYLSTENVGLAFFDEDISFELKTKMKDLILINNEEEGDDKEDDEEEDKEEERDVEEEDSGEEGKQSTKGVKALEKKVRLKFDNVEEVVKNDMGVAQFISKDTKRLFERFQLNMEFLREEPCEWSQNEGYIKAKQILSKLRVVNDIAERGVQLIQQYNSKLTTNEEQKQWILQNVAENRKTAPDALKRTLRSSSVRKM